MRQREAPRWRGRTGGPHERWVLITDGAQNQNRSALAAARAAAAAGWNVTVTVSGRWSLAASSRSCLRTVTVPPAGSADYAEAVRNELSTRRYALLLPASDAAILALDSPGKDLVDKAALQQRALAAAIEQPPTVTASNADELRDAASSLGFPLVVKPLLKRATKAPPARRILDERGLRDIVDWSIAYAVQPFISDGLRAVAGVVWNGRLVAAVHQSYLRTWPRVCGVASAAETVGADSELENALLRLLTGFNGIFQAQFAGTRLIDVNPRAYGSLPLAVEAGVNLVAVAADLASGVEVPTHRARTGVRYRWLEGDIRHIVGAARAGTMGIADAAAAIRPRRGTVHSVESMRDPVPALARLAYAVTR